MISCTFSWVECCRHAGLRVVRQFLDFLVYFVVLSDSCLVLGWITCCPTTFGSYRHVGLLVVQQSMNFLDNVSYWILVLLGYVLSGYFWIYCRHAGLRVVRLSLGSSRAADWTHCGALSCLEFLNSRCRKGCHSCCAFFSTSFFEMLCLCDRAINCLSQMLSSRSVVAHAVLLLLHPENMCCKLEVSMQ